MWVRGQENASKLYLIKCAAYNLGLLLRKVWGLIKPRGLAGLRTVGLCLVLALGFASGAVWAAVAVITLVWAVLLHHFSRRSVPTLHRTENPTSLTGC